MNYKNPKKYQSRTFDKISALENIIFRYYNLRIAKNLSLEFSFVREKI